MSEDDKDAVEKEQEKLQEIREKNSRGDELYDKEEEEWFRILDFNEAAGSIFITYSTYGSGYDITASQFMENMDNSTYVPGSEVSDDVLDDKLTDKLHNSISNQEEPDEEKDEGGSDSEDEFKEIDDEIGEYIEEMEEDEQENDEEKDEGGSDSEDDKDAVEKEQEKLQEIREKNSRGDEFYDNEKDRWFKIENFDDASGSIFITYPTFGSVGITASQFMENMDNSTYVPGSEVSDDVFAEKYIEEMKEDEQENDEEVEDMSLEELNSKINDINSKIKELEDKDELEGLSDVEREKMSELTGKLLECKGEYSNRFSSKSYEELPDSDIKGEKRYYLQEKQGNEWKKLTRPYKDDDGFNSKEEAIDVLEDKIGNIDTELRVSKNSNYEDKFGWSPGGANRPTLKKLIHTPPGLVEEWVSGMTEKQLERAENLLVNRIHRYEKEFDHPAEDARERKKIIERRVVEEESKESENDEEQEKSTEDNEEQEKSTEDNEDEVENKIDQLLEAKEERRISRKKEKLELPEFNWEELVEKKIFKTLHKFNGEMTNSIKSDLKLAAEGYLVEKVVTEWKLIDELNVDINRFRKHGAEKVFKASTSRGSKYLENYLKELFSGNYSDYRDGNKHTWVFPQKDGLWAIIIYFVDREFADQIERGNIPDDVEYWKMVFASIIDDETFEDLVEENRDEILEALQEKYDDKYTSEEEIASEEETGPWGGIKGEEETNEEDSDIGEEITEGIPGTSSEGKEEDHNEKVGTEGGEEGPQDITEDFNDFLGNEEEEGDESTVTGDEEEKESEGEIDEGEEISFKDMPNPTDFSGKTSWTDWVSAVSKHVDKLSTPPKKYVYNMVRDGELTKEEAWKKILNAREHVQETMAQENVNKTNAWKIMLGEEIKEEKEEEDELEKEYEEKKHKKLKDEGNFKDIIISKIEDEFDGKLTPTIMEHENSIMIITGEDDIKPPLELETDKLPEITFDLTPTIEEITSSYVEEVKEGMTNSSLEEIWGEKRSEEKEKELEEGEVKLRENMKVGGTEITEGEIFDEVEDKIEPEWIASVRERPEKLMGSEEGTVRKQEDIGFEKKKEEFLANVVYLINRVPESIETKEGVMKYIARGLTIIKPSKVKEAHMWIYLELTGDTHPKGSMDKDDYEKYYKVNKLGVPNPSFEQ